ncbi:Apolipoprotein D [Pseudolycoriella hygida]|uniref:Apolipoprotein D n=1 Tax=Pseudolycoriella hygida TaxID=35572 RepID=A0A9Q0NBP1_9DIPT|nr:Apolipoprotein D [Pseudolycoriella hygida]
MLRTSKFIKIDDLHNIMLQRFDARLIFVLLLKCGMLSAQVPAFGKCPEYLGLWYEAEKYPFVFEIAGKCITATYDKMENGDVSVVNRQINRFTGSEGRVSGSATIISPGKLSVRFSSLPTPANNIEANYWVLDTDYSTFAVVYSCRDLGIMSGKTLQKAYAVLDKNRVTKTYLMRTDQYNCNVENASYPPPEELF